MIGYILMNPYNEGYDKKDIYWKNVLGALLKEKKKQAMEECMHLFHF